MTRRRIPGPFGDRVDVHRVDVHRLVQDEALLTRLAHEQQSGLLQGDCSTPPPDPSALTVESFLADWRERTVSPELPPPPSAKAIQRAARAAGLSAPARSNSFRAAVGIVASVAFLLSGTAIAGARSARPGDVLWPVTRTFWADRAEATLARHDIDVALGRAAAALAAGDRNGADQALMVAAAALPRIPADARGALQLRMQQVGAGMNASPAPAAQAAEPAGTPQAVPGPQARPGVPVVPVAASSTGGGSFPPPNEQASGIGAPGDQEADTSRSAPWKPGQGSTPAVASEPVASEPVAPEPVASEPESTQTRATVPGSPSGDGSAPTTGSPLSVPPTTGSSPEQTSAGRTTAAESTPSDSTGPTPQPSTSADATSTPSTTAPSTVPTTASPTAPSTASSTATTGPGDTAAPTTSSADSVSADAVPTSATPSRRTTRPPPGFAPPPVDTPASRTSATETSATEASATEASATEASATQTSATDPSAAETTAATVAR
ncbi:MAG: hypothetical protein WKF57_05210 [Nakamurella sp.]